jgi:hypothetical protein
LTGVAIVGAGKGINEGEVDEFSNVPQEMALRNEMVDTELIV